ncbi:hypothetical protein AABB24_037910 [Solanum stoloniferum]|uniref:Exostosin GT47 domain-containing protein n=1 Tax=Solanum stoloniferum TaxID=62892 RepID=A0ABD2QVE9_9SOLN
MAAFTFSLCFLLSFTFLFVLVHPSSSSSASPYLYPSTFSMNYNKMLTSFKIFIYPTTQRITFYSPSASNFYDSVLNSAFIAQEPEEAHLFFVVFSPEVSTRSQARLVRELRTKYPYWNRTLGADHFFISPEGIDFSSDRNALELKKNSVQISVFPTVSGYLKWDGKTEEELVEELRLDSEFVVETEPLDQLGRVKTSKFCLFFYEAESTADLTEAMAAGCVPVVIVDRPVQDFPLMDVLRWSEMALLIGNRRGGQGLKTVLGGVPEDRYERMRELCVAAAHHMVWNAEPQAYDAFHMVIYQLWMRRHTIRYTRREEF